MTQPIILLVGVRGSHRGGGAALPHHEKVCSETLRGASFVDRLLEYKTGPDPAFPLCRVCRVSLGILSAGHQLA